MLLIIIKVTINYDNNLCDLLCSTHCEELDSQTCSHLIKIIFNSQTAHLALMDSLMAAFTAKKVTIETVVKAVR